MDAFGMCWSICTRQTETILKAWFDEVLPSSFVIDLDGTVFWPRITVWPMWAWKKGPLTDPDWLTDSRVLGRRIELQATDGAEGLAALLDIRRSLERELAGCSNG